MWPGATDSRAEATLEKAGDRNTHVTVSRALTQQCSVFANASKIATFSLRIQLKFIENNNIFALFTVWGQYTFNSEHMKVRGQLAVVSFLLPPCGPGDGTRGLVMLSKHSTR